MRHATEEERRHDAVMREINKLKTAQLRADISADLDRKLAPLRAYAFAVDVHRAARRPRR